MAESNGVGALGICGPGVAVANATYSAIGVSARLFLLTVDELLDRLPDFP